MIVSPRADELVIRSNASDNLTSWFVRSIEGKGVPGLRLECRPNGSAFCLIHVPTGARMTITSAGEPSGCGARVHDHGWRADHWLTTETPIRQDELVALAGIPPRTRDATTLLAALLVRLEARDPGGNWAIGSWWYDPLGRAPRLDDVGDTHRRLWGANDHWTLEWNEYPREADLIRALTDPVAGIGPCQVERSIDHVELRYGTAVLRLVHVPSALKRNLAQRAGVQRGSAPTAPGT
ncbi:hypothetical protein [Amycolatopsis lurida]|uniref:hypothetical protein n=1 Tax=Amycolatopsis lurida TaxID=31959 RepID=UPI0036555F5E